jgi:nitrate reductase gamma subunit
MRVLFGIIIPYLAFLTFFVGLIYRVIGWARSPVPFRIPTTGGQQKTLPWIKYNRFDNPSNTIGVVGRMIFEVLTFRSLFRNTRMEFSQGLATSGRNGSGYSRSCFTMPFWWW